MGIVFPESPSKTMPIHHLTSGARPHTAVPRPSERAPFGRRSRRCSREKLADLYTLVPPYFPKLPRLSVRPGSHAGGIHAHAPVAAVQSMARLLSPAASASSGGVIDVGDLRCAVGRSPSPATSPSCIELPRKAPGPLAIVYECALPFPTSPRA